MLESKLIKSFPLGSAVIQVKTTDPGDPAAEYSIHIEGDFPGTFAGLPRSTMLRIVRALALMARQSATAANRDLNTWANQLPGHKSRPPKGAQKANDAQKQVPASAKK